MAEFINGIEVKSDCLHFRGDIPCKPNKVHGYHCAGCPVYTPVLKKILIIKLGAIGDVIRTTPLLTKIRKEYSDAKVTWLTLTPAILPSSAIEEILAFELKNIIYLENTSFDILINLDKDREACGLANRIQAREKFGYMLKDGIPYPANKLAEHKFSTGIFDDVSIANTKSYVEEIFEIAGWKFADEEYVFDNHDDKGFVWKFDKSKKLIGLNTGCGDRWTTRLWSEEKWLELIASLKNKGYEPVLLGGQQEDEKNIKLSKASGALYPGYFSLPQFINLANQMDVIVSQVTMAMHIAVGLRKRLILMNNIFNPHEFYLYNRGQMVSPSKKCDCFYRGTCIHGTSCMEQLAPGKVMEAVENSLKH
jgi:ADP-heptose:LPS heptosyltransferase